MTEVAEAPAGGWAFPSDNISSRAKAHAWDSTKLFERSLCGKWAYGGTRIQAPLDTKPSKDDCAACRKIVEKRKPNE